VALAQLVTRGFSTGSNTGTASLVITRGYGVGAPAAPAPVTPSTGGGQRFRAQRRTLAPYKTEGRVVPVDDTLYRQMFPDKAVPSTAVERTDEKLPVALLLAWMAGFDE
jgi:hypothetical protein